MIFLFIFMKTEREDSRRRWRVNRTARQRKTKRRRKNKLSQAAVIVISTACLLSASHITPGKMPERKQPVHKYCKRRKGTRSKWWKRRCEYYVMAVWQCSPVLTSETARTYNNIVAASVGRSSIRNNKDEQSIDMAARKLETTKMVMFNY